MVGIRMVRLGLQDGTVKTLSVLKLAFLMCRNALLQGLIYCQFHVGDMISRLHKRKLPSLGAEA